MTPDAAQTLSLQALAWLLGDEELRDIFLGSTGASVEDLRQNAADPVWLASVMDFVLLDDKWVNECASALAIPPERVADARRALPGGELPHWT